MSKTYTKREFLKMMGLGLAFLPFMSCFNHSSSNTEQEADGGQQKKDQRAEDNSGDELKVSDEDILLLTRDDQRYADFNMAFNKRIKHLPKYIAVCRTEKGVQYAIQKAKAEKLKVAVKSGGHSFEGFSSNDGGMVINVSLMKKISWLENDEVLMGPGCLLQEVQAGLFPRKRLLPSGSCGTVGIAGLTLGGGYGFFSRKYGLTCDSLLELTMVGADGRVYTTKDDKELLWACKGGGNGNFGVVTSFRFKTYDMPPTFDSYVLKFRNMNVERFESSLSTWFDVSEKIPEEAFAAYVLNGKTLTILITTYKSIPGFDQLIAPLTVLADSTSPTLNADLPKAMKRYYGRKGPLYFKNASAGLYRGKADILQVKEALFGLVAGNPGIVFQVNTLGGKIADGTFEGTSCYPHRQLAYLGELQAYWELESKEAGLVKAFEDIQTLFRNGGIEAHYRNYPDINFKDWEKAYYGDNYGRLQEVKRKYDKDDLFHYPQSIRV
ncbi:FAD-binding oxidoreductase [Taibaiella koreensis]|uniref:FAD-binding oxidoreductase n=1 Tax=Taibaiella koreensis TaxID=1268548 RepID=UPI000E5A0D4A|nr:FAD-binding oxidoreductase [Taibaiella koreensis]